MKRNRETQRKQIQEITRLNSFDLAPQSVIGLILTIVIVEIQSKPINRVNKAVENEPSNAMELSIPLRS